jgi:hypothetical protein
VYSGLKSEANNSSLFIKPKGVTCGAIRLM